MDKPRDLAARMAGWFFQAIGGVLIMIAVALAFQSSWTWATIVGALGVGVLAFAVRASDELKALVLYALVSVFFP